MLPDLPSGYYKFRPLRNGDSGYDVWAMQLNLPGLTADGIFGPKSDADVRSYQRANGLAVDGIVGLRTQQSLLLTGAATAQAQFKTPGGLIRGIIEGESGWQIAAVSKVYADGSRDVGCVQQHISPAGLINEGVLANAFTSSSACAQTLSLLRQRKDTYAGRNTDEDAWRFAVGSHNWPAAAAQFANHTAATWQYQAKVPGTEITKTYLMSDPAEWVEAIGVPGIKTGDQWWNFYIASKVAYVHSWTT